MKKIIFLSIVFILFISGCNSANNKDSQVHYRKIEIPENEKQETVNSNQVAAELTTNPEEIVNHEPSITSEYMSSFKGIESQFETPKSGNLNINEKLGSYLCLVCPDNDNTIYYVNYGKDNYIYQLKDGVSTLLVDRQTQYIQLWKDDLYFLGYNGTEGTIYQNIYKYNFITKEIELIAEAKTLGMNINSDGIYYSELKFDEATNSYRGTGHLFSFKNSSIEQTELRDYLFYKNYILQFIFDNDQCSLRLTQQDKDISVLNISDANYSMKTCICQDYLCYSSNDKKFNIIDLKSGRKYVIDLGYSIFSDPKGNPNKLIAHDYAIIGDELYITTGTSNIFQCNLKDVSISKMIIANSGINELYSNGDRLFATRIKAQSGKLDTKELIELLPSDGEIKVKELGIR